MASNEQQTFMGWIRIKNANRQLHSSIRDQEVTPAPPRFRGCTAGRQGAGLGSIQTMERRLAF